MMSGRCVPPASGWLLTRMSPRLKFPLCFSAWYATAYCMEPRCTGTLGAFATSAASGPKIAQEKLAVQLETTTARGQAETPTPVAP